MKISLKRISAFTASMLVTGLVGLTGVAAADGMPGWGGGWDNGWGWNPGFNRFNRVDNRIFTQRTSNDVRVNNTNNQFAQSGNAIVSGNLFGGSAISGDAINNNSTATNIGIGY